MTAAVETPTLRTPRLTLRPPRSGDAGRIVSLIGEYAVASMLAAVPHPYTLRDARDWLEGRVEKPDDISCAIDDGTGLIGVASLAAVDARTRRLGFWLGAPCWGRGLMSEAVGALVAWGFGPGGLDRIESSAFLDNLASRRIHAKLGFAEGAETVLPSPARGRSDPGILLSLTREDWTPIP